MTNFILFCTFLRTHGLNGEIVARCDFENPKGFTGTFFIKENNKMIAFPVKITGFLNGGNIIIKCGEINSIEEARKIIKKEIYISRSELPTLDTGEYYACDLIGLEVWNIKNNQKIGIVVDLVDFGSGPNIEVKNLQEKLEYYVFNNSTKVELDSKVIKINLPEYV
jgi:16S rRNA processing protein RimM